MKYKLSEIMDIIGGGTPKTSNPEYWNGNIPWLSVKDFNNDYRYVYETEKAITQAGLDNSSTKMLKRNDSIISARGTVGEMAMIPFPMAFNQSCYGLRAKKGLVDAEYLYYLIKHNVVVLKKNTHGSVFDTITHDTFDDIEVELPSLKEQKVVASILRNLDDKIEVNNEINKNLEQQARSLFKAWFVDFDPFANTMLSDWKKGKLKDILKLKRQSIKTGENTTLPYLPIDVIPMRTFALTDFKPNAEAQSSLITFDKDDIIIGAMRVYFHRVVLAPCDGITRTTCFTLAPYNNEYLSFALLCCDQESSIDYAQSTSKGSTMPYAIWEGGLGDMEIIIPTPEIAKKFNEIVLPMLRQIQNSYFENNRLREIRNALLPRLMSDEVDVSNLDL
ncbi:restriction endonuclease subunit S [Lactobacillus iners]|nr:restriction endonuclease subunit S [Lactobacillus iners]